MLGDFRTQTQAYNTNFERARAEIDMLQHEVVRLGAAVRSVDERCPCSLSDDERELRDSEYVPPPVASSPVPVAERVALPVPVPAPEVGAIIRVLLADTNNPPLGDDSNP